MTVVTRINVRTNFKMDDLVAGPSGRRDPTSARYTRGKAKSGKAADCLASPHRGRLRAL